MKNNLKQFSEGGLLICVVAGISVIWAFIVTVSAVAGR